MKTFDHMSPKCCKGRRETSKEWSRLHCTRDHCSQCQGLDASFALACLRLYCKSKVFPARWMSTSSVQGKQSGEERTTLLSICTYFIIQALVNSLISLPSSLVAARRIGNILALNVQWNNRGYISSMERQGRNPMKCKGNCQRQEPCTPHPNRKMHEW